jgi:predicted transposase YdaD
MHNLEVQVKYYPLGEHENRVVFHGCRLLSKQLRSGENFYQVRPVIVIFFNFESASKDFVKHISLKDESGLLYSELIRLYEVNTMETVSAKPDQQLVKIISYFLLYACEREKFFRKLAVEGITHENETVKLLMRFYDRLTRDNKIKEDLKIMEMTVDDKVFLFSRNYAEAIEKGFLEGIERGKLEGIEKGVGTTLSIIQALNQNKSVTEIAEMYNISAEKVKEIQKAVRI